MTIILFQHLHKCGGTSVRHTFQEDGWTMVPYCASRKDAFKFLYAHQNDTRIFWEIHCWTMFSLSNIINKLPKSHEKYSAILFRNPVDMAISYYYYFGTPAPKGERYNKCNKYSNNCTELRDWSSANPNVLLRIMKMNTSEEACPQTKRRIEVYVSDFDQVGFLEDETSYAQLLKYANAKSLREKNKRPLLANPGTLVRDHVYKNNRCAFQIYDYLKHRKTHINKKIQY